MADATMKWQAEFGLGQVEERQAQMMRGANEATFFLKRALLHYLNIIAQEDETMDMFWVKKAGLQALSVAETLQDWDNVSGLCDRLGELLPTERANLEKKKVRAEQAKAQAKNAESAEH